MSARAWRRRYKGGHGKRPGEGPAAWIRPNPPHRTVQRSTCACNARPAQDHSLSAKRPQYRLGVDVGGTHTDLVLLDSDTGELLVEKVASTPKNPAFGVLDGIARFAARGIDPRDIAFFGHGTTITTNALLEMRGAKVGLLITNGYRAVQDVQNQARDGNLFDYFYSKPVPIVPQSLTKEIPERCDYAGPVLQPLDRDAGRRASRELNP